MVEHKAKMWQRSSNLRCHHQLEGSYLEVEREPGCSNRLQPTLHVGTEQPVVVVLIRDVMSNSDEVPTSRESPQARDLGANRGAREVDPADNAPDEIDLVCD